MINFEKFVNEGHRILNELSVELGHPEEKERTGIVLRAVLHTLRNHISIPQSLNLLAQLPMFLKGIYVEQWKYHEKPIRIKSLEHFAEEVEKEQSNFGESRFDWDQSTIDISKTVLNYLRKYISEGEIEDITAELPKELKELFYEHA
ncbi:DUF2267 domain-containing protein [Cytophagaceae bacterium ABcell3]|nr:DUF2267 domain-containing protein [Cytophagaceae bacterium ABcell3]